MIRKSNKMQLPIAIVLCTTGNNKAVEALISQGADVNSKDIDLWTPLFYASTKTGMSMHFYLIANGKRKLDFN